METLNLFEKMQKALSYLQENIDPNNFVKILTEALDPERGFPSSWAQNRSALRENLTDLDLFELIKRGLPVHLAALIGLDADYCTTDLWLNRILNPAAPADERMVAIQTKIICDYVSESADLNYGGWGNLKAILLRKAAGIQQQLG